MANVAVALGHCPTSTAESRHFLCTCSGSATAAPTPTLSSSPTSFLLNADNSPFPSFLSKPALPRSRNRPNPPLLRLFTSSTSSSDRAIDIRGRGLRLPGSSPREDSFSEEEEEEEEEDSGLDPGSLKKSRNQKKREARRAVRWGMDLAKFSPPQIKRVLGAASLEKEVFDALMLVKRLGPDVREGRRRQFNYIGKLLRKAHPDLMDGLIQASKDGDSSKLQALSGLETFAVEDEYKEEEDADYEDGCDSYVDTANRWLYGLIYKDSSVTNEVYSIYNVEFDRQELRKLVHRVHSIRECQPDEEKDREDDVALIRAKNALARFLRVIAKQSVAE